ncbi:hypothetical protein JCM8097_002913 [Rhodosporidiobolus ruineniae]
MARFGLVDSDSESDHSDSTARRSSTAEQPDHEHSFASSTPPEHDDDASFDDDEAPPRSSLHDDGPSGSDEELDGSADGEEDDDDDLMADDTFVGHTRTTKAKHGSGRTTRDTSAALSSSRASSRRSYSHQPPSSLGSRSPSPPPRRRALLPPSSAAKNQQQQPWAQKLKLEPKRVQVMQASFFHQPDSPDVLDSPAGRREQETEEREKKRRAVEERLASRSGGVAAPTPAASAPAPVPTPVFDPAPFRSLRTYQRVPLARSVTNGKEGNLVDAGLALGRSFRVGWGPQGEIVSLKGVYAGGTEGKSDGLKVEKLQLLENDDPSSALRLLKLQLSQTEIFPPASSSSSSAPAAVPASSLRFSHFVDLFTASSSSPSSSSPSSSSEEAQLFKLAHALFDEIPDLALPTPSTAASEDDLEALTPRYSATILALRRRAQLSQWLEDAVASEVETDLRALPASQLTASGAKRIFALLSGHQLERACAAAVSSGNLRLATLLAQAGSSATDPQFAADVYLQLAKWREYRADSLIDPELRRVYELLCGNLGVSEGRDGGPAEDRAEEIHVLDGVGWKRAVGMGVWYGLRGAGAEGAEGEGDAGVGEAVRRYEAALADVRVARPTPAYLSSPPSSAARTWAPEEKKNAAKSDKPQDPAFHLLKLFTSPTHALESALAPRNFGSSPADYRLPWHLYLILSRVLRWRDFEDREDVVAGEDGDEAMGGKDGEERVEGNSVGADGMTVSYAAQLEGMGLWEWAAFVLLHLELDAHRTAAIKALLARHFDDLADEDSDKVRFLLETLKVPAVWLYSARADLALSRPAQRFASYTLLLRSLRASEAHRLAVEELVPEAVVRGDSGLVRRLLEPFVEDGQEEEEEGGVRGTVEGWEEGGKVYLLYLAVLSASSTSLHASSLSSTAPLLARALSAVQAFSARVASTPRTKNNLKLRLATGEMMSRLNVLAKAAAGAGAPHLLDKLQPSVLPESDRGVWIQGATRAFWETSLERAGAVQAV